MSAEWDSLERRIAERQRPSPAGMRGRVLGAVRRELRANAPAPLPWWSLAAAASVLLVLGFNLSVPIGRMDARSLSCGAPGTLSAEQVMEFAPDLNPRDAEAMARRLNVSRLRSAGLHVLRPVRLSTRNAKED